MGVRGLETYLERHNPDACYRVNIKEIVEKYRQETGKIPKIVIDGYSFSCKWYQKYFSWIVNGQMREFYEEVRKFILKFLNLGVELITFFDGILVPQKRSEWIRRREEAILDFLNLLDEVDAGGDLENIQERHKSYLPTNCAILVAYTLLMHGCKVKRSISECDIEISRYALKNDCLAVLSQDSDFVIYEGARYYLSLKHLDIESMTTVSYDGVKLAKSLNILPGHLPLVASLMGNDIIHYDLLIPFKRRLQNSCFQRQVNFKWNIEKISSYVRNLPVGQEMFNYLPQVAKEVFCDETKAQLIHCSLNSYNVHIQDPEIIRSGNSNWDSILELARNLYVNGAPVLYAVMYNQNYYCASGIEDFRKTDFPPSNLVLQNLRQHVYGILLYEKPLPDNQLYHEVKELIVVSEKIPNEDVITTSIPPQVTHPGLRDLWNEKDENLNGIRWALVGDAVQINPLLIQKLPEHLIVPSLSLYYLLKQGVKIHKWEINAMLSSCIVLRDLSIDNLKSLPLAICDARSICLQSIFFRSFFNIITLIHICGNPLSVENLSPTNYQDGKLFHCKYKLAKSGCSISELCEYKVQNIETFNLVSDFLQA